MGESAWKIVMTSSPRLTTGETVGTAAVNGYANEPMDLWRRRASKLPARTIRNSILDIQRVIVQMDFSKMKSPEERAANEKVLAALLRRQAILRSVLIERGDDKAEDAIGFNKAISDVKVQRAF